MSHLQATSVLTSVPEDAQHTRLIRVLYKLNTALTDRYAANTDEHLPLLDSAFVNIKLTSKLARPLEEPTILLSADWALDLSQHFPFLFPFIMRYAFLQSTSFAYARLVLKWQAQQARAQDSRRDDAFAFLWRLQRQHVRISRKHILESVVKVFQLYGLSSSILEIEYFEVGTGLGPTLEFYSMLVRRRQDVASQSASRHRRWIELHFNDRRRISGVQALTWGLDKSRPLRPQYEERTFHVIYQFLAGATPDECDWFALEDPSEYALLSSSGSAGATDCPENRLATTRPQWRSVEARSGRSSSIKPKHMYTIQSVLVAVLLLRNLQFAALDEPALVATWCEQLLEYDDIMLRSDLVYFCQHVFGIINTSYLSSLLPLEKGGLPITEYVMFNSHVPHVQVPSTAFQASTDFQHAKVRTSSGVQHLSLVHSAPPGAIQDLDGQSMRPPAASSSRTLDVQRRPVTLIHPASVAGILTDDPQIATSRGIQQSVPCGC
ncbi:hypothetical protein EXIGLDRAFT_775568 [Exidia glandulosa HHB12029]|uniref:Myosin motor domain-containing protein n=1 Tax=Exidia glandulosa HHB12029 TaxID=1314781 RepID=A0A165DVL9_EXIGL|nr:hypothetical protein EXIGLDRAFT_775568 [Exidia glandulosa HHB12029]